MVENRQFSDTTSQTYVDDFKKFCATPRSKRKFRAPTRAAASCSPELAGKAFSPCKMPAVQSHPVPEQRMVKSMLMQYKA